MVATIIVAVLVLVAFVAALRYSLKHHTSCAECGGGDPSCTLGQCGHHGHEDYRQQSLEALWKDQTGGR